MNFSNTKKLRKILSLVIVMIMMTSLFAGCGKKIKPDPSTEPTINFDDLVAPTTAPETQPPTTEPTEINENMATVLSQLNVRSSPTDQATQVGTLYAGDKVEIDQVQTSLGIEWGHIYSPMTGWVCMEFVEMDFKPDDFSTPAGTNTDEPTRPNDDEDPIDKLDKDEGGNGNSTVLFKGTVTASELNIREKASTGAKSVGSLKRGTPVEILEKNGDWGRIKQGWISLQHVKVDNGSSNNNNNNSNNTSTDKGNGSTSVVARGIVNTSELNIRAEADSKSDRVGSYTSGTRVEILEKSNGWGRTNKGWISLNYVYIDGSGTGNNKHGVVTGNGLNIRSGPGKNYDTVGSLNEGNDVTILYRVTVGGTTWGNIKQGWISMDYVDLDDAEGDDYSGNAGNNNDDVVARGIITAEGLNVRKAASADSDKVGSVDYGTRVEILEKSNGWGRINKGWINLDYVYEDGSGDGGEYGKISGSGVNVRSGPGKNYGVVGSLDSGDEVTVLFQLKVGDTTWGNIKQGWISMAYVDVG